MVPRAQPYRSLELASPLNKASKYTKEASEAEADSPTDAASDAASDNEAIMRDGHANLTGFGFPNDNSASSLSPAPITRPKNSRSSTAPSPSSLLQGYFAGANPSNQHEKQRNRSPYSRSHLRSRSSGSSLAAPTMTRAHSLPSVQAASRAFEFGSATLTTSSSGTSSPSISSSGSPLRSPARVRSPFRNQDDASLAPPRSPSWFEMGVPAIESIQEDSELDLTPRQPSAATSTPPISRSGSLRRRPASPLHSVVVHAPQPIQQAPTSFPISLADPSTGSTSPLLQAQKYNEAFPSPSLHHYASTSSFSSISTTPSSVRSRSPSISSLETIEDAPDLESAAVEAERSSRLKLAAERAERLERGDNVDDLDGGVRRKSLDTPKGFGFGRAGGAGRERKRWSICGGERRGDLDLETIWED